MSAPPTALNATRIGFADGLKQDNHSNNLLQCVQPHCFEECNQLFKDLHQRPRAIGLTPDKLNNMPDHEIVYAFCYQ